MTKKRPLPTNMEQLMVIGMIFPIKHQQVREEVKHHIIKMFNLSPFMYIIVAFLWFFQCSQECLSVFEKLLVWFFFFVVNTVVFISIFYL